MKNILALCIGVFALTISFLAFCGDKKGAGQGPSNSKRNSFTENKQWEQRLNERLRSGMEVHMIKPVSGTNFIGKTLDFEWTTSKPLKLFLGLLNNENKEIFYKEVAGNKVSISATEYELKPGLYYWVLESEEDVLTVGKLYYKKK